MAVAAGLSAPFSAHYGRETEPGGFHFYGPSSRGKTTLLCAVASVYGVGAEKKDGGIVDSWHSTPFAGEQTAAKHSDCALLLDEIKSAKPEDVGDLIYQFANGAGKKAGTSSGGLRDTKNFRPTVISTGEISSRQYIESNGQDYHGGLSVRMIDVPADTLSGFGIFSTVPSRFEGDAGAFAQWIKQQAATNYGFHARALIAHYIQDRENFLNDVRTRRSRGTRCSGRARR